VDNLVDNPRLDGRKRPLSGTWGCLPVFWAKLKNHINQ